MFTFDSVRPQRHEAVDARGLLSAELRIDGRIEQAGSPLFQDVRFMGADVIAASAEALSAPALRTGPKPSVSVRVEQEMRDMLKTGAMTWDQLRLLQGKELEARFKAARTTCSKVREKVLGTLNTTATNPDTTATNRGRTATNDK